jgi:type II secretory pathway component PulK
MNDNVKNNNTKNTKASAMIYALVFLYITSLIAIGLINLFESQLKLASSKIRLEQRYELLNTGLDIAMSFLLIFLIIQLLLLII